LQLIRSRSLQNNAGSRLICAGAFAERAASSPKAIVHMTTNNKAAMISAILECADRLPSSIPYSPFIKTSVQKIVYQLAPYLECHIIANKTRMSVTFNIPETKHFWPIMFVVFFLHTTVAYAIIVQGRMSRNNTKNSKLFRFYLCIF